MSMDYPLTKKIKFSILSSCKSNISAAVAAAMLVITLNLLLANFVLERNKVISAMLSFRSCFYAGSSFTIYINNKYNINITFTKYKIVSN